jgi:D-glycero-D-manno-heptose 1,7-bisphosphate phosphatase
MYLQIAAHFGVGLQGVPVIGDSLRDLEAAIAAGAQPLLVRTGNGKSTEELLTDEMAFVPVFDDLAAAALHILSDQ